MPERAAGSKVHPAAWVIGGIVFVGAFALMSTSRAPTPTDLPGGLSWSEEITRACARRFGLDAPGRRLDRADAVLLVSCVEGAKAEKARRDR
jgi:hypothetical protein